MEGMATVVRKQVGHLLSVACEVPWACRCQTGWFSWCSASYSGPLGAGDTTGRAVSPKSSRPSLGHKGRSRAHPAYSPWAGTLWKTALFRGGLLLVCTDALSFKVGHGLLRHRASQSGYVGPQAVTLGSVPLRCKRAHSPTIISNVGEAAPGDRFGVSPLGNMPGKEQLCWEGRGHCLLPQRTSQVTLLLTVCPCFLLQNHEAALRFSVTLRGCQRAPLDPNPRCSGPTCPRRPPSSGRSRPPARFLATAPASGGRGKVGL